MGKVCDICGHMGFSNALLECSECSIVYAHQYCLGIPPGTIDETFDWFCEYCSVPVENESSQKFEGRNEVVALPEELEPLCVLPPIHEYSTIEEACNLSRKQVPMSSFMEHPDSIMRGTVLIVSPLGEVFIYKEEPMSSFIEHPDSIMRGIVRLGSPSGDVFIDNGKMMGTTKTKGSLDTSMHDKITADMSSKGKKAPLLGKGSPVKRKRGDTSGSLTAEKNSVRKRIVDMLLRAGWTVEYRPRNSRPYSDAVYVNREGKAHWSVPNAYNALLREEAKRRKTGGPNSKFTPLPKKVLSKLFRDASKKRSDGINKQTNSRIPRY